MTRPYDRKLVLEDGSTYPGWGFGAGQDALCEVVFNTSMVGYQEILTDPSYTDQAVVMTYPLIGNYGINDDDNETSAPSAGALVVRAYNDEPSNFRSTATLSQRMQKWGIPGLWGVDTRKLTRSIRDKGTRRALLTGVDTPVDEALARIAAAPVPQDAVSRVSCARPWTSDVPGARWHVVAIDCGMKHNIVRSFNRRGCRVTAVPWNTSPAAILALQPDGLFVSNGPGDPEDVQPVIHTLRALRGTLPIFGICLGHQLLCLSYGAATYKLKFGHRGGNHPVRNLQTGRVEITSQNHSYAVDAQSLAGTPLKATHINLLDNTIEGMECARDGVFSVQYHPESAPGPQDSAYLFDRMIQLMEEWKRNA